MQRRMGNCQYINLSPTNQRVVQCTRLARAVRVVEQWLTSRAVGELHVISETWGLFQVVLLVLVVASKGHILFYLFFYTCDLAATFLLLSCDLAIWLPSCATCDGRSGCIAETQHGFDADVLYTPTV